VSERPFGDFDLSASTDAHGELVGMAPAAESEEARAIVTRVAGAIGGEGP
jgi:hypothetical protein